jgi:hypothetical protein
MTSNQGHTRKNRRTQGWGESSYCGVAICTHIVLVGTELAAFSCNFLEVLLSRSVGIANLKQQTLFTDGLAMELIDDLFTDLAGLKASY